MREKPLKPTDTYFIRWRKDEKYYFCRHLSRTGLHAFIKRLIRDGVRVDDMEFGRERKNA